MSRVSNTDESPREYLIGKGFELSKKTMVRKDNFRIPCPACGKFEACDVNVRTGQWKCLRSSCEEGGGLYKMKTLLGDAYEIGAPIAKDRAAFNAERLEAELVAAYRESSADPVSEKEVLDPVERWHRDLLESDAAATAREYLKGRGITRKVIELAKLGWASSPPSNVDSAPPAARAPKSVARKLPAAARKRAVAQGGASGVRRPPKGRAASQKLSQSAARKGPGSAGLITIPYFDDGKVVLVKLRWVPPEPVDSKTGKVRRYQRIAGGRTVLYQPFGPVEPGKELLLVGGELDALSVGVALLEVGDPSELNVAATSAGEGGWSDDFGEVLDECADLVVIYDGDAGGRNGAKKVADAMGRHRVRIGEWPEGHNDANDALKAGDLDGFAVLACMKAARSPVAASVSSVGDKAEDYLARRAGGSLVASITTGHVDVNNLTGGFRPGEATVWTGETGIGKTTAVLEMVDNGARAGARTILCPFEDGVFAYLEKIIRRETGRRPETVEDDEVRRILRLRENLWILDHHGEVKPDALRATMLYAMHRLGIRAFMFDHIDFMTKRGRGESEAKDVLIHTIQSTIRDSPAHAHVLAHPSKGSSNDSKGAKDNRVIQLADVKGHSTVTQDFANVASIWRPRRADRSEITVKDTDEPDHTVVLVWLKARHANGREGKVKLLFDPKTERYRRHPWHFTNPIPFNPANPDATEEQRETHRAEEDLPI